MRTRIKVTDLSSTQWDYLREALWTEYDATPNSPRVCVGFERSPMDERHVEMPLSAFKAVLFDLHQIDINLIAEAVLTPDHLGAQRDAADPARVVRNDCAFCHRERSPKDDNHAPECPYWTIGPGSMTKPDA